MICTIPLGCLKAKTVQFDPPLPLEKQTAIDSLGFGTIDKYFLFCERRWWPEAAEMLIVWSDEAKKSFKPSHQDASLYKNTDDMLWYQHVIGFIVEQSIPIPVLVAFASGRWAKVIEQLPDKEVLAVLGDLVTQIIIPQLDTASCSSSMNKKAPVGMIRTKWAQDPYSKGSYSHVPVNVSMEMFNVLAAPLPSIEKPVLLFAGEATHNKYFSCVHAAWLSGEREAKRLIKLIAKNC